MNDGLAEVVVSTATGPLARVAFALALLTGRHGARDDVLVTRGREVTISGAAVAFDADGELGEPAAVRTWRLDSAAWSVLTPR